MFYQTVFESDSEMRAYLDAFEIEEPSYEWDDLPAAVEEAALPEMPTPIKVAIDVELVYPVPCGPHQRWWYNPPLEQQRAFKAYVRQRLEDLVGRYHAQIEELEWLLQSAEDDWHSRYLYRLIKEKKRAGRARAQRQRVLAAKRQAAQEAWFNGGREAAYYKKYHYGCLSHAWFVGRWYDITGELVDTFDHEDWEESCEEVSDSAPRVWKKVRRSEPVFYGPYHRPQLPPKRRDAVLLLKLREIIKKLRARRTSTFYAEPVFETGKCKFEADEGPHGEAETPSIAQSSNIVITEQHGASVAADTPAAPSASLVCSDIVDNYSSLVNRELVYKTFDWSNEVQGTELLHISLPRDFVTSISGTPNSVPFDFNRYMRGDIRVRVQINANPFMIGSLQIAWFYQGNCDKNIKNRINIASGSQTLHTIINAGTSNEAILEIPYKNFKPLIEIGQRADKDKSLYFGDLYIMVLNPLQATSTSSNTASVSVFISFVNTEFTGYIHRDINKPEMEAAAGLVALSVAERMLDSNRDKPTSSAHPTYFSPQVAQSWAHGTGQSEDTYDLRLERADVPHPARYTDAPFTQQDICKRFGYCKTIQWSSSLANNSLLTSFAGQPFVDKGQYHQITTVDEGTAFVLPPVAFMANLFQYWRGSLNLRLDAVATKFHTGRLLLTYVPGDYRPDLTLAHIKASTSVIFDLKEMQQCNFRIPYMADKQYWPRNIDVVSTDTTAYAPGFVYIFVLNKLVSMDNISNFIYMNMYIAGGDDFELIIPAQPTIGLSFSTQTIQPTGAKAYITNDTSDGHYIGTYTDLRLNNATANLYPGIMRYGPLFGHLTQIWMPKKPDYINNKFFYLQCDNWNIPVRSTIDKPVADTHTDVAIPFYDGDYIYVLPVRSAERAQQWGRDMIANKGKYSAFATEAYCRLTFFPYPKGDDADPYSSGTYFKVIEVTSGVDGGFELVDSPPAKFEMDSRVDLEQPLLSGVGTVPSTSYGKSELGEYFGDLKTICRRYQLYGNVHLESSTVMAPGKVLFEFPVLPQGLDLDIGTDAKPQHIWNHLREGIIPLLLSGYRFFRGSIRFRMSLPDANATYFVQHIPYSYSKNRKISVINKYVNGNNCINHGYAYAVQTRFINNILSFEVPFYLNVDCMLLQQSELPKDIKGVTDLAYALSLGTVRVGIVKGTPIDKPTKVNGYDFEIMYALGDDARPSVFQGFPPVIFTGDILPVAKFEMQAMKDFFGAATAAAKASKALSDVNLLQVEEKTVEALANFSDASQTMNEFIGKLNNVGESATGAFSEMMDALKSAHAPHILLTALSHCSQVLYNPDPVVIGIAISSFLLSLGVACMETLKAIADACTSLFRTLLQKHPEGENATYQSEFDTTDISALASMLFAGVSTALNVKAASNSKFTKGLSVDLMEGITKGASGAAIFFRFLSNIMGTLVKIYDYLITKLFPEQLGLEHIITERELVTSWVQQCVFLLAPETENMFDICPQLIDQVHSAYILGSVVMAKLSSVPRGVNTTVIREFYSKIVSLRTTLYDKGYGGTIRREPYVVWMGGAPGIGKSHLASKMCLDMLDYVDIPIVASPVYYHPAGAKYWENLNQEPVIMMDDAFVTRSGETNESEIVTFMAIKSPCLFTPPMAECDRKKKRYAPEIVYVNSNNPFPELNNMETKEAIYRRRDIMWTAHLKTEYSNVKEVPLDILRKYDHLYFTRVVNPSDPQSLHASNKNYTYQAMREITLNEFKLFRDKQIVAHQHKVDYINESVARILQDERVKTDPLAKYLRDYANAHSFPDILRFVPTARELLEREQERNTFQSPNLEENIFRKIDNFLKSRKWTALECELARYFANHFSEFRDDVKNGSVQAELKNNKCLPGKYLAFFALGFKFIDLIEALGVGNGLRMLYAMTRDANVKLHSGCAQAALYMIRERKRFEKLKYEVIKLDGVEQMEAREVLNVYKTEQERQITAELDAITPAPEPVSVPQPVHIEQPVNKVEEVKEPPPPAAVNVDVPEKPALISVEAVVHLPPPKPPSEPPPKAPVIPTHVKDLISIHKEREKLKLENEKMVSQILELKKKAAEDANAAVQRLAERVEQANVVAVEKVDDPSKIVIVEEEEETEGSVVNGVVPKAKVDELHSKLTWNKICKFHSLYLYNVLKVEDKCAGARLVCSPSRILEFDNPDKFHEFLVKNIGEKSLICPHIFGVFLKFTTTVSTCCFDGVDVRHWCVNKNCNEDGCVGNIRYVLDRKCPKNCMLNKPSLRMYLRGLYTKHNPGIIGSFVNDLDNIPQVLKYSSLSVAFESITGALKSLFSTIYTYLKKGASILASGASCLFRFIKRYKWLFIAAAGVVGSIFVYRNKESLGEHINTTVHIVTNPREIVEGAQALYSGTKENVKDLFRSVKNCISSDRAIGDLGEVEEINVTAAQHEMVSSSDPRMTQRAARAAFKSTTLSRAGGAAKAKAEAAQGHEVLRRLLISNTVILVATDTEYTPGGIAPTIQKFIRGLFIGDRYCVTVAHSWEVFNNSGCKYVGFFRRDRWVQCKIDSIVYIGMSDQILCVLEFPACVPQFRNIVNFLATEADHCIRTPSSGSLIKIDEHLTEILIPITPRFEKLPVSGSALSSSIVAETCYQYPVQAEGVCGSVLVASDRNAPIFGMHFAGNDATRIGYSAPLYRETFQPLFDMRPIVDFAYEIENVLLDSKESIIDIKTCVFEVGKVPRTHQHKSAEKTQIVKSQIFDYIPHTSEPAPLTPKDPRLPPGSSPLIKGVEKHGMLTDDFPNDVLTRTRERLRTFLIVNCKPHRTVVLPTLTDQQAVCGDPQLPFCDPIAWSSSEGFPWFAMRPPGVTDKKWLFDLEETAQGYKLKGFHPRLEQHIIGCRNRRKLGQVIPTVFTDCLKDARIPVSKVSTPGKTRIFSMSPVDYTIEFRKYFYDFISSFQHNRFSCSNMIGANVFSDEWNVLARTLLRHNNICTGDYSNFGPGLNEQVAQVCCELILDWYEFYWPATDEEDNNIRKAMLTELINALHLCKDLVYKVGAGIPSGSPITVVLNSLVNIFYIYAAWDIMSAKWPVQLQSFQNFQENIVLYTYGDDFIFSVSDLYKDLFNSKTISECLAHYKIKLTDAFKGDEVTPYSTLENSSFLKNKFVFFDNRYWAGLDKDSIHDMANWIKESPDPKQALVDNCEAALLHAQGHGRHYFNDFRARLIRELGAVGIEFQPRTWNQIVSLKLGSATDPFYAAYIHKMVG
ncbi:MAG: polyprotein [Hangzhou recilia dorsalis iflavirus 1]|nr:MAG: polyprotein [Hangzhou recilia dorsalis iflavirus 1]